MLRHTLPLLLLIALEADAQLYCVFTVTPENCTQMNGTVTAGVSGGTPGYSFLWTPNPPNGQGTSGISGLAAGSYDLLVTDAMGLQQTFNVVVPNDPTLGNVGDGTYAGAFASTGFGVPCEGACNGGMAMPGFLFGGTPPYTFSWSDPGITYLTNTPQGDPVYVGFCAGQIYTYTVTDNLGCSSLSIPFTPPVVLDASHWYVSAVTPATCGNADGSVQVMQTATWPADAVVVDAGGAVVFTNTLGGATHTFTGLAAGTYTAYFNYSAGDCSSTLAFTVTEVGPGCGSVTGTLFLDSDVDCVPDAGEAGIPYRTLQVDPGAQLAITNADGSFARGLADGSYTLTVLDPTVTPACPQAQPIPFSISGGLTTLTIGAGSSSAMDLTVSAVNNAARPGFAHAIWAQVTNTGALPSGTIDLTCTLDPALTFLSADPQPTSVNGGVVTWNIAALGPFAGLNVQVITQVGTGAPLGDVVEVTFTAVNNGAEGNTANNTFTASRTITGSYDPNDKTAFTSTRQSATDYVLAQDEWIDYVIRFQNTGTDTAFTVVITDTLAADLDMATFEQGAASHPFTVSFKPGRVVEWRFANILLPDSNTNEPLSHGAVGFRIRPVQPLAAGTVLSNAADIFFDFNPPIRTNTSELVASVSTGIQGQGQGQVQVYPNPAHDRITVRMAETQLRQLRSLTVDGRVVRDLRVSGTQADVDLEGLAPGMYLLHAITADGAVHTRPFVVQ
jgi:uncharacterized repeat protein (TIGR01451 family)